jgi:hypothetical protein
VVSQDQVAKPILMMTSGRWHLSFTACCQWQCPYFFI